jgi:hypothetical protein
MSFFKPGISYSTWMPFLLISTIIISRLCAILIFEGTNIFNDSGIRIKLGGEPAFLDYPLYKNSVSTAWSEITRPLKFFNLLLDDWQGAFAWLKIQQLKAGPIYPMLIGLTSYDESRYLLSIIYQIAGTLLGWHWAKTLSDRGQAFWLQISCACFPALVYYSFLVSTDLLYACLVALWLVGAKAVLENKAGALSAVGIAMLLLLLARPNSLALLPMMSFLAWRVKSFKSWILWSLFWGFVGVYMLIYYLPYYWVHDSNAGATHYLGFLPSEYYKGLWTEVPTWISQPLSWLLFAVSKLMHAVGLRPSYASVDTWLVVVRALPGLVFLPGLIYLFFVGQLFEKWFVFFFMLPVFIGASQERYLLALTPILLLWGVRAWSRAGRWGFRQLGYETS